MTMIDGKTLRKYMSGEHEINYDIAGTVPPNVTNNLREGSLDGPQVNPNEILHNMLDHIHDGNREELVGQMILMLGWLHQGGTMPNISKDTVTSTTLWIIPQDK